MAEGYPVRAGGTINICRAVKIDTTADNQVIQGTLNAVCVGVATEEVKYPPGIAGSDNATAAVVTDPIRIYTEGEACLAEAGAAVTAGDALKSDSAGRLIPATGTGNNILGYATQAASGSGVRFMMRINRMFE